MSSLNALNDHCIYLVLDQMPDADVINTFLGSSHRVRNTVQGYYIRRVSLGLAVVNFANGILTIDAANVPYIRDNCPNIGAVFEESLSTVKYTKDAGVASAQDLRSFYQLCLRGGNSLMNVNTIIIECRIRNSYDVQEVFNILPIIPTITILDLDCNFNGPINLQNWLMVFVKLNNGLSRHVVIFYNRLKTNNAHSDLFNKINNNDFVLKFFNVLNITMVEK